jgi:hypothetical protein
LAGDRSPNPLKVQFPFCLKPDGLESAINNGQVKFAGEKVVQAVGELEPYKGGNKDLWSLQALDNSDKHRLPIITWRAAEMIAYDLGMLGLGLEGPGTLRFTGNDDVHLRVESVVFPDIPRSQRRRMGRFERETDFQPAYSICFGEGQPFEHEAVVAALVRASKEVERAITKLVDAFLSQA